MSYGLGVDLGTTFTAAATYDNGTATMVGLGNRALQIPSVLYLRPGEPPLVGEAAERRGLEDPGPLVREFKRRFGDPVAIMVGGTPYSAPALTAHLLRWVLQQTTERLGSPPTSVTLTRPANWGEFKLDLLRDVARLADVQNALTCTEPEAAAVEYASRHPVSPGENIAIYDLGGGTFDICFFVRTTDGFQMVGRPDGIEQLGGVDFDEAVFQFVIGNAGLDLDRVDPNDPDLVSGVRQLRRNCVDAKEALSQDVDTVVSVAIADIRTSVRVTRPDFEALILPALEDTVRATQRGLRSSGLSLDAISTFVLVGGSSRIPLVSEVLGRAFHCAIARDTHPKHDVAMGAARVCSTPAMATELLPRNILQADRRPAAPPTVGTGAAIAFAPAGEETVERGRKVHLRRHDTELGREEPVTERVAAAELERDSNQSRTRETRQEQHRPSRFRWLAAAGIAAVAVAIVVWRVLATHSDTLSPASGPSGQSTSLPGENTAGPAATQSGPDTSDMQEGAADVCRFINTTWPGLQGTTVSYFTNGGGEQLWASLKPFQACTGVEITKEAMAGPFELLNRASTGDLPDLASVYQPGIFTQLAQTPGVVQPLPDLAAANARRYYDASWLDVGSIESTLYALPLDAAVKSLVWYSPKAFQERGLSVPQTYQQLVALSDAIVAEKSIPWCAGILPGWAGAWPASDWLEDMVLQMYGPDVYDQWVEHSIPFDDQRVVNALLAVQEILKNPEYVNGGFGGVKTIGSTPVNDAGLPILTEKCFLHHRDSDYQTLWPSGTKISEQGDVYAFAMPALTPDLGAPIMVGGRYTAAFTTRPEVQALQYYLTTPAWADAFMAAGLSVTPHKGVDQSLVRSPINRLAVDLMHRPNQVIRFDASDQVPPDVGSGSEPDALYRWIADGEEPAVALADIERAWPPR